MISDLPSLAPVSARRWMARSTGPPLTCDAPMTATSGCHRLLSQVHLFPCGAQFRVFQVRIIHPFPHLWYCQWQLSFLFCLSFLLFSCDSPSREYEFRLWSSDPNSWNWWLATEETRLHQRLQDQQWQMGKKPGHSYSNMWRRQKILQLISYGDRGTLHLQSTGGGSAPYHWQMGKEPCLKLLPKTTLLLLPYSRCVANITAASPKRPGVHMDHSPKHVRWWYHQYSPHTTFSTKRDAGYLVSPHPIPIQMGQTQSLFSPSITGYPLGKGY